MTISGEVYEGSRASELVRARPSHARRDRHRDWFRPGAIVFAGSWIGDLTSWEWCWTSWRQRPWRNFRARRLHRCGHRHRRADPCAPSGLWSPSARPRCSASTGRSSPDAPAEHARPLHAGGIPIDEEQGVEKRLRGKLADNRLMKCSGNRGGQATFLGAARNGPAGTSRRI